VIPASISATAMTVATQCLSRYAAENMGKNRTGSGAPAQLGTACHNALEDYVKSCHMGAVEERSEPSLDYLLMLYRMHFMVEFDSIDPAGDMYDDGLDMMKRWHERTNFDGFTVYSVEDKKPFPVTVTDKDGTPHSVPFNYIFDRLDQIDETTYRVVDYKTWRAAITSDDLTNKLQARAYALACQIQFPHATKIWVQFDQLRYDSVGIVFTKEQNINTWRYLQKWLRVILNTDIKDVKETVNPECKWCIKKASCDAITRNTVAGGVAGKSIVDIIDRRADLEAQAAAIEWAMKELDEALTVAAKNENAETLSSDKNQVYWSRSARRGIDRMDVLEGIIGSQMMERVGKRSVTLSQLDKLLKGPELTEDQKKQVKALVTVNYGEPRVKVKPLNKIDVK